MPEDPTAQTTPKRPDHELRFSSLLRNLSFRQQLSLLCKMQDCAGQLEPARVWCSICETGGCVLWFNREVSDN